MTRLRILHLGLGAFHRAHQAVYLQDLIDAGDTRWELAGGHIRPESPDTAELLKAQGGAYTVETVTPDGGLAYRRIEALRTPVPYRADLAELQSLAADPATRIISFTVTEAGYADDSAPVSTAAGHTIYGALPVQHHLQALRIAEGDFIGFARAAHGQRVRDQPVERQRTASRPASSRPAGRASSTVRRRGSAPRA
jgi:hypothetical protein